MKDLKDQIATKIMPFKPAVKNLVVSNFERINELRYRAWKRRLTEKPILREPIFVIGCPRSATSIFVKLFAMHPWVANWSEAGRIWDPVEGDSPNADHFWDKEKVDGEVSDRLHSIFEWYRLKEGKKRFVNKHPRNSVRIEFIQAIFPDAFFIHVVRDGRAVVHSIVRKIMEEPARQRIPFGNFCKPPGWRKCIRDDIYEQTALQWREIVKYIAGYEKMIGSRYFHLKYEDLCLHPRKTLAAAFRFAGLSASPRDLTGIPETMKNMNYKYQDQLSVTQLDTINRIQKDMLLQFGYDT